MNVPQMFASNVFNQKVMQDLLPKETFKALKRTIDNEVEHRERLEEMVERHNLMKAPHQGYAQNGIAESSADDGQPEQFDVDVVSHKKIKSSSIESYTRQSDSYEIIDIKPPFHKPQPREQAGWPYPYQ